MKLVHSVFSFFSDSKSDSKLNMLNHSLCLDRCFNAHIFKCE